MLHVVTANVRERPRLVVACRTCEARGPAAATVEGAIELWNAGAPHPDGGRG